jgi:uncharacterized protein YbjT (DUF2867 family)
VKAALERARPGRVVCLSTIGAQATRTNLLTQLSLMEQALSGLNMPVTFLRPGWFMENFAWDIASARDHGVIASFLTPTDRPVPMIATADVGRVAAQLLQEESQGRRVVELEAASRISPDEAAAVLGQLLGHKVVAQAVPRESWPDLFLAQGMKNPEPRIRMLEGFNEGWIAFEGSENSIVKGKTSLETVLTAALSGVAVRG